MTYASITLLDGRVAALGAYVLGEAAEILCERHLGGSRVKHGRRAEDVVANRQHIQVKARRHRVAGRQIELRDFGFDQLFVVLFDDSGMFVERAGMLPKHCLTRWPKRRWSDTNNAWEFSLTREFWEQPDMVDLTTELQAYDMREIYTQVYNEIAPEVDA